MGKPNYNLVPDMLIQPKYIINKCLKTVAKDKCIMLNECAMWYGDLIPRSCGAVMMIVRREHRQYIRRKRSGYK